jgi:hypothetical protein
MPLSDVNGTLDAGSYEALLDVGGSLRTPGTEPKWCRKDPQFIEFMIATLYQYAQTYPRIWPLLFGPKNRINQQLIH